MAVRWPDGSYTGSVLVSEKAPAPAPVVEPEPEKTTEPVKVSKKEADYGSR